MQQYTSAHVCQRDAHHDDESTNIEAITPCFEDELAGISRLCHISLVDRHGILVQSDWSHSSELHAANGTFGSEYSLSVN